MKLNTIAFKKGLKIIDDFWDNIVVLYAYLTNIEVELFKKSLL